MFILMNIMKSSFEVHISLQTLFTDENGTIVIFFFSFEIQFKICDCPFTQGLYDILTVSNLMKMLPSFKNNDIILKYCS